MTKLTTDERLDLLDDHLTNLNKKMDSYLSAFPLDAHGVPDTDGHRSYHDALISTARVRKEFWQKMLFELTKWGLLGFIGWLVIHAWSDFLLGPGK